ncbi:MAG: POT family MFS transporter [Methylotenera sp.]|nr:POT family MFS transporter [Oligoflexia bacterium]
MNSATATSPVSTAGMKFPKQIRYIVGNEACERFSYYGMRSILVMFMIQHLMLSEAKSGEVYHLFAAACYLFPLAGAFISDRYLGKYKTIMILSIVYCLGHGVLAVWESQMGLYVGLALIAMGSGGIKPCVSAHVGDQFDETNKALVNKVFDLFYFCINFGAFFSTLFIPYIWKAYGASWAFGIPGILMAIATYMFWVGRKYYVHVPPTGKGGSAGFMAVVTYSLMNMSKKKKGQSLLDVARDKYSEEEVEAAKAAAGIFKLFATVSVFWALFDQSGSSWVIQAEKMDLVVFGTKLQSSQIGALNPIMVMVLIPLFSFGVYPMVEKMGIKLTPLRKMSTGMILAAASFVICGVLQMAIDSGHSVSVAWQIIPYLIITVSEIMISITGLEFAYTQAPRSMKSTIMSFWLLTVFVGNLLVAYIDRITLFKMASPGYFMFFAALMLAVAFIFVLSATRYKVRDVIEKATGLGRPAGMVPEPAGG